MRLPWTQILEVNELVLVEHADVTRDPLGSPWRANAWPRPSCHGDLCEFQKQFIHDTSTTANEFI